MAVQSGTGGYAGKMLRVDPTSGRSSEKILDGATLRKYVGGTAAGSGIFFVISKGAATNLAGASQANGFFGAFLKFAGFDGIIIQG